MINRKLLVAKDDQNLRWFSVRNPLRVLRLRHLSRNKNLSARIMGIMQCAARIVMSRNSVFVFF